MSKPLFSFRLNFLFFLGTLFLAACRPPSAQGTGKDLQPFAETFESGSKRSYNAAEVRLHSGVWLLDHALIGASASDRCRGQASLRLAAGGAAEMRFDLASRPDTLSLRYAAFGSDRDVRLSVWSSPDGGAHWQLVGRSRSSYRQGLGGLELPLPQGPREPIRFRIRNDGTGRVNVDDFGTGRLSGEAATETSDLGVAEDSPVQRYPNALLGNPGGEASTAPVSENLLLERPQYTVSYNSDRGTPNWVSWHLSGAEQGHAPRCNCFAADTSLPRGIYRVQTSDYSGSGFDRGHICASDDRSRSPRDNAATFLMPNIAPQAPEMNQKCWRELEEYARRLTTSGKELYIISGVYGIGGTGSNGPARRIASGRVTVPAHFWKIILVIPEGNDDLRRINAETEIIAIDVPNKQSAGRYSWESFRCTVSSLEKATGYRFFTALPPAIADALRTR